MTHQHHRFLSVRRLALVALLVGGSVGATASTAGAAPSRGGCPKADHWALTDRTTWESLSEQGIVAEFGSMDAGAEALGFASAAELRSAFGQTFDYVDGIAPGPSDGWICVSSVHPPGLPAFLFSVHNNKFRA